jgi:hypothetical protein
MTDYFSTKSVSTDQWLGSNVTGDDTDKWRFVVEADGKIRWAPGGSSNSDVILQRSNFSQLDYDDPGYWAYPLLTLYRGNGTTPADLQLGSIRLKDSGTIIKWYPDYHTELDIAPGFEPNDYRVHLYCTTVNPNDRRTGPLDPMLSTDYAFFVEKDFKTFGFMGTSSDPEKQIGGGAIQMGQGFTGKYCPPIFDLTGTMTAASNDDAIRIYNYGSSLPGSGSERDIFYNTTDKTIYQYGVTGSGWRPISTVGNIGSYPAGANLPPSGEYEQWFYKTSTKELYQYTKISSDPITYDWKPRFSNVQSPDYDTLFLMRADFTHPYDPITLSNLHLGGLTATNAVYVDQIKHLNGTDWSFNDWNGGTVTNPIILQSTFTYDQAAGTWAKLNTGSTYGLLINYNTGTQKTNGAFQVCNGLTTALLDLDGSGNLTVKGSLKFNQTAGTWANLQSASTYGLLVNYNTGAEKTGGAFQVCNGLTSVLLDLDNNGDLTIKGGLHTIDGTALTLRQDTKVEHADTVYFNVNSTNSSSSVINLQSGGSTKTAFGYQPGSPNTTFLYDYAGYLVIGTQNGGDIVLSAGGSSSYNVRLWGGKHMIPQSYESGMVGNSSYPFYASYTRTVYAKYSGTYDAYDDLRLVKQWGNADAEDAFSILKSEDNMEYYDLFKMASFSIGCSKALVLKQEQYDAQINALLGRLESLENQLEANPT